ncbi:heterokaryon incompatibility protein-domain-containing protein [Phyllosticta capitalensis]|uniref:Heterokaryon incompatibility protein-domain-containing protein n=1 Tax=Phyllosticta capitalensis TaxID=121624 RepID=A0ABR1YAR4_9PEZI
MEPCKLCATIPFDNLPPFPKPTGWSRVADHDDMPELLYRNFSEDDSIAWNVPKDPLGFPYHENLGALAESAADCPLCSIVQAGVVRWKELYHEAIRTPSFIEFHGEQWTIPERAKLWLTKRPTGAAGFVVLARNLNNPKDGIFLLTGVSLSVKSDSPLASRFPLRPVEVDAGSASCLDIAKSWLEHCVENHTGATLQDKLVQRGQLAQELDAKDPPLPTRVLEIDSDIETIRLLDGVGLSGRYACLSYCWGSSRAFTLTRGSIEARKSGIAVSELPKSIHDAVLIARHLGLRYLWVDSLCICQDDVDDWAQQSAYMNDIYSNSRLVIAATHAADKSDGCFNQREQRPTALINCPGLENVYAQMLFPGHENGFASFDSEPLSQRGWALQERVLARRILHYNTRQMYFECDHGVVGEDGCGSDSRYCSEQGLDAQPSKDFHLWNSILEAYGPRKLSKRTDKLPAMSGLASLFKKRFQAEYIAGLWSHKLISGLAWQGLGGEKPSSPEYTGPSWSWASFDGIAAGHVASRDYWIAVASVVEWHTELKERANPYGEVKDAWIRIHAPMTELFLSNKETIDHEVRLRRVGYTPLPRFCTKYSDDEDGSMVRLNYEEDNMSKGWLEWEMHVLLLQEKPRRQKSDNCGETSGDVLCYGMVVRRIEVGQESQFERVGWTFLGGNEAVGLRDEEQNWATIKLV